MIKFNIFNKVEKLYINRSLIINVVALIFISPLLINAIFKGYKMSDLEIVLGILSCVLIFIGLITKFYGQFNYEKLKGKIEGFIELHDDKIIVNEKVYEIEKIKKIEIYNGDYKGKWKSKIRSNYSNALSNGVDNVIRIIMENEKESIGIYFLQNEKYELKKAEKQLIKYYQSGKIHLLKLLDILNITDYDEIQKFKNTIR